MIVNLFIIVFPAPAGMSLNMFIADIESSGFPRTCGDEPKVVGTPVKWVVFSPHLRG